MMFKRLFGGGDDAPPPSVEFPWQAGPGSFFKTGFIAPDGLASSELQVTGVHALDLGAHVRRVLTIESLDLGKLQLWHGERDKIAIARLIDRRDVERLFDVDQFALLFDHDEPPNLVLERRKERKGFVGWTDAVYRQEGAQEAYIQDVDPDETEVGDALGKGVRAVDHYRLVGDDREHALEAIVHDGGRTDVALIALLAVTVVEEIWTA